MAAPPAGAGSPATLRSHGCPGAASLHGRHRDGDRGLGGRRRPRRPGHGRPRRHPGRATGAVLGLGGPARRRRRRCARRRRARPRRDLFRMEVDLPLPWSAEVATRAFVVGRDEAGLGGGQQPGLRRAPEQSRLDRRRVRELEGEDWFDPEGFLSTSDDGGIAGFCWTKVHRRPAQPPGAGEIYVIGVDPRRQGIGLGRGADARRPRLARTGAASRVGMLYVDAANDAAVGLYRALGFARCTDRPGAYDLPAARRRERRASRPSLRRRRGPSSTSSSSGRAALPRRPGVARAVPAARRSRRCTELPGGCAAGSPTRCPPALDRVTERTAADDMTTKWLWALRRDGAQIETVLMRYPDACHGVRVVSRRAARWACTFCATGQAGFERHLDRGRDRRAGGAGRGTPPTTQRVSATSCSWGWASRSRTTTRRGPRSTGSTTTSGSRPATSPCRTVGVVPGIRRLAARGAAGDAGGVAARGPTTSCATSWCPLNRRYPIADVLDGGRRVGGAHATAGSASSTR